MHGTLPNDVDDEERARRRKAGLKLRPDATACAGLVIACQEFERRPACITAADVERREQALKRAAALSTQMPDGWPNPKVEWHIETSPHSPGEECGWHRDENGVASRRPKRGPHERVMHRDEDDDDDDCDGSHYAAPARKRGRPRLHGINGSHEMMTPADASARYRSKLLAAQEQSAEPASAYPLTLMAARNRDSSSWALGDALVIECSETSKTGVKDGSGEKLAAASKCLAENGIKLGVSHLGELRYTSSAFKDPSHRKLGVTVCSSARSPEVLDRCIGLLLEGATLTVSFVARTVRSINGRTGKRDGRSNKITLLIGRLCAALRSQPKELRIKSVALIMNAIDVGLSDLGGLDFAPRILARVTPGARRAA